MAESEFWWTVDKNNRVYISWRSSFVGKIRTFYLGKFSSDLLNLHIITIAKIIRAGEGIHEIHIKNSEVKFSGKKNSWQIDLNIKNTYKNTISGLSDFAVDKLSVIGNVLQ
jgi:hypothetical protein